MELLGVGVAEAFVVLVISLIVVGPQRFPEIARQGGRYFRMARRYARRGHRRRARRDEAELEAEVEEQREELLAAQEDISSGISTSIEETRSDIRDIGRETQEALRDAPAAQAQADSEPDPSGNGAAPPAAASGLLTPRELPAGDGENG